MTTITCQYTNFMFEAASSRSKNHPLVAKFLVEASKELNVRPMAYRKAKELLAEAIGQFEDIEELMSAVNAAYADWRTGAPQRKVLSYKERRDMGNAQMRAFDRSRHGDRDREINDLDDFRTSGSSGQFYNEAEL